MIRIVTVDDSLFRRNKERCEQFGLNAVKVVGVEGSAVTEEQVAGMPEGYVMNAVKYAIRESMRNAAMCGGGIVLQEDWLLTEHPQWDGETFTLFGGKGLGGHWCPRGFAANKTMMTQLVDAWLDTTVNACAGWLGTIRHRFTYRDILEQVT